MSLKLRRARKGDEESFLRVKKRLPMPSSPQESARGGFLLGTNVETYRFYIENSYANVLENDGEIVGFAIILPDALLRRSDLWRRKNEIEWENGAPTDLLDKPLCYFEQLAVLPGAKNRFYGVSLAFATLRQAFEKHEAVFATLVVEPVFNPASIPFLESVGASRVAAVDEFLPEFGNLVSAVYSLEREVFAERIGRHRLAAKIIRQIETVGEF